MKNIFYPLLTALVIVFTNNNHLSAQQTNAKIQEVFADKTQDLVMNDPIRLSFLTDLIENRVKVIEMPVNGGKEVYIKLSTIPLVNKYNTTLARDITIDPTNFNPLKYDLNFSSKKTEVYRIDNTNYIIVIQPQLLK